MPMRTIRGALMAAPMVMVEAVKRGTVTHDRGVFHFDPKGFEDARGRPVPEDVAQLAKDKGLVRITDGEFHRRSETRGPHVDETASRHLEGKAEALGEGYEGMGGGDTISTTLTRVPNDHYHRNRDGMEMNGRDDDRDEDPIRDEDEGLDPVPPRERRARAKARIETAAAVAKGKKGAVDPDAPAGDPPPPPQAPPAD